MVMILRWNNKQFTPLKVINVKSDPYGREGVLRHYHYRSYPKFGPDIVAIRTIPCS